MYLPLEVGEIGAMIIEMHYLEFCEYTTAVKLQEANRLFKNRTRNQVSRTN